MKKDEAISILATSVRPREPKDRARYDEAVKMAIEALKSSEQTAESAQNASSCARENDVIFRQAAIDALKGLPTWWADEGGYYGGAQPPMVALLDPEDAVSAIENLPSAQPATNCSEIPNSSDDTISRQAAIDAIMGQPPEPHYPSWYAAQIEKLPAAQPDHVADSGKKVSISCGQENDLISRQAAIDALDEQIEQCNKALGSFDISPKDEYAIKVERASLKAYRELLENLPSAQPEQKTDEWIPISKETNPTKSGWYLVTVHEDATNDNERFTGVAEFNAINGMWYDIDEPTDMYLRWMPLPEPYRGGDSE